MFKRKKKQQKKVKLSKEEKKIMKARQARMKKRRAQFKGQNGFYNDGGYVEYDGYLRVGEDGRYIAIYDVVIQYGTHNPESVGWLTQLIPSQNLQNGDIYFALREKGTPKSVEDDILAKRVSSRQATNANGKDSSDVRERSKKEMEQEDLVLTQSLAKTDKIIDSDCLLVVKADTPEKLEATIKELRQNYKDDGINGIMFIRRTGKQIDALTGMFHSISANAWHNADMETVAAGRLFLPSSGFSDETGVYVGTDVHSFIAGNPTIIDFYNIRHAVIMTGGTRGQLSVDGLEHPARVGNFGSAWATVIAEDNYLTNGTRTHFINLVPFPYYTTENKIFDMRKYTINSLETYGTRETVTEDANNNFDKITEIIMMLMNTNKPEIRALLQKALIDWFIYRANGNGMYTADPQNEPTKAYQILATTDHQNYPTVQDFITELQSVVAEEARKGEMARGKADMLLNTVKTASRRYPQFFNDKTNIPDRLTRNDRNIYYDLAHLTHDRAVKGAMFLNVLAYVTNRAQTGDMVVVTGLDSIKINPRILKPYRDRLDERGIGLITTFEEREDAEMNVEALNDFTHGLKNQDLVVLGSLTENSLKVVNESWQRDLPKMVQDDLLGGGDGQFYVYRQRDYGSAVVQAHLVL